MEFIIINEVNVYWLGLGIHQPLSPYADPDWTASLTFSLRGKKQWEKVKAGIDPGH